MKTKNVRRKQHRRYLRHLAMLYPPGANVHVVLGIAVSATTLAPRATFRHRTRRDEAYALAWEARHPTPIPDDCPLCATAG